jgi:Lambda phage tail tape-measure protein (Tape_meas_lam_C)
MANEPRLVVALDARLEAFEENLRRAGQIAEREVKTIEGTFSRIAPDITPAIDKMATDASSAAKTAGALIGGLIGGGISAALVGAISIVGQLSDQMRELETTARRTGLTIEDLQRLQFAGAVTGVKDVNKGLETMAERLNDARRNENELTRLLTANNIKFKERAGEALNTNKALEIASDLIRRASSEVDKIDIARMLGLTKEWVELLDRSPQSLDALLRRADEVGAVLDRQTVQRAAEFSRQWAAATTEWSAFFRSALVGLIPLIDDFIKKLTDVPETTRRATGAAVLAAPAAEIDKATASVGNFVAAMLLGRDANEVLALLFESLKKFGTGELIGALQDAQKAIENVQGAARGLKALTLPPAGEVVPVPQPRPAGAPTIIPPRKQVEETTTAFDRQVDAINKHIKVMEADAVSIGKGVFEQQRARTEAKLLEAALRDQEVVTEAQRKEIERLSVEYGNAALAAAKATASFQLTSQITQTAVSGFADALVDFASGAKSFEDAFRQMTASVLKDIAKLLIQKSLLNLLLGPAGAGGGLLPRLQAGGPVAGGRAVIVGERGPEIFVPGTSGLVLPNAAISGGGGGTVINMPINSVVNAPAGMNKAELQSVLAIERRRMRAEVVPIIKTAASRGAL